MAGQGSPAAPKLTVASAAQAEPSSQARQGGSIGGPRNSAEGYGPATDSLTAAAGPMLTGPYRLSATHLPTGLVLVAGGNDGGCCITNCAWYQSRSALSMPQALARFKN
jgi:hypothetical protein